MNPIVFALRRPMTVMVLVVAVALGSILAVTRMPIDIFPNLNLPVVYVCQPFGGMDPAQMEGLLTNYYEYHFLYINGIHHVESRNIQGMALMKLYFHPGTNMAQAMAEVIGYVTRSRAFMPPGTVSPFITRFDAGSVPVGYLVLSSETKSIGEIQDQALFKVRPMFASLPGVSRRRRSAAVSGRWSSGSTQTGSGPTGCRPTRCIGALSSGNTISPSGTVRIGKMMPIVPINSLVRQVQELETIPIRPGQDPTVYIRDVATVKDASDIPTGYALVNGRRAVYILVTKRADASTLSVVNNVKTALPGMQAVLPDDIKVSFEFDQSPTVTNAVRSLVTEGALGAVLTGLMVLLFLRDWRSVIVVVLNIPFALCGALVAMWLTGQTINLMTLGGLALAIGILVDESTVEVENIHHQMEGTSSVARAVRRGQPADGHPPAPGDALRAGGVHSVVLHARSGPGALRPAVAGRRLRHGDFVSPLQHLRAGPVDLAAAPPSPSPGSRRTAATLAVRAWTRWLWPGRGRRGARALGDRAGLPRRHPRGDRAGGPVARPGDLPQGRRRAVPAPDAGARRHPV